ncbi:MAG: hypothetical protein GTO02_21910 [Candidatus Dadabacteria bacterium]|nr:hypothetical protein [Candidatus Dadabacteria bacterium]NIQ16941.1 hypothetical protein [Candidatus Dadabacteria bacterium]
MKYFTYLILAIILATPINGFAGSGVTEIVISNTDTPFTRREAAYYDLRDRKTYIQISNTSTSTNNIHIQIFQNDRDCNELDFFDSLTPNDTVIYDLDNIIKNDGKPAPINLADNSYGYVVITAENSPIIGNVRIVDDSGYEYRSNTVDMVELPFTSEPFQVDIDFYANFNTVDGAKFADVIGFAVDTRKSGFDNTAANESNGVSFDIFVYDMDEDPLSCDRRNFACGKVMNYGINEDYPASRGEDLLCPGGGLANPDGGYILFTNPNGFDRDCVNNPQNDSNDVFCAGRGGEIFIGLIGINNGNGTGSLDIWHLITRNATIETNPPPSDKRLKNNINLIHKLENGVKLYSFNYKNSASLIDQTYVGVMAQDLNELGLENAVVTMPNGYYAVDYSKLGLRMTTLKEWEEKGLNSVMIDYNY